ncbi:MAG: ABC transporter ATP-binding protein, partial [Gemmatimonadaceae bacterium]|nr:ABC transporter ATP-binding protein [Chitinophagaceae bacterium]
LSGGMKQKLALCCALIHKPTVLFLDEPTTGVDPVSRKEFWEMLARLRENNITIVVSTPYMDEAAICDRIALIQSGKILSIDTPAKLTKSFPHPLVAVRAGSMPLLLKVLAGFSSVKESYAFGESAHVSFQSETAPTDSLSAYLKANGIANPEIKEVEPTIEDCFIHLLKN